MPKLIDYPRTSYTGAWELAEITDDTGGKCTIETAARKLNRKVSGSFKAIIGSAVKFGLVTSKRELLTTTTLFKRIKHAYDKQEELAFHREAFLTPPLFTQICRKFRSRELPVQMLDVMLIREFGVEEINAQGVAKAFVDGCRMVGLLDEHNTIADIDAISAKQPARQQQLASPVPNVNAFRTEDNSSLAVTPTGTTVSKGDRDYSLLEGSTQSSQPNGTRKLHNNGNEHSPTERNTDAIATLFGLVTNPTATPKVIAEELQRVTTPQNNTEAQEINTHNLSDVGPVVPFKPSLVETTKTDYQVKISGPGINTELTITEEEDITLAIALLEKIRRQINSSL
ncbi:hypothetical protein ACVWYF_000178 [Hymenobacter sp. UYAg731]